MLLGASIGNCLIGALLLCMSKKREKIEEIKAEVKISFKTTPEGYKRIDKIEVKMMTEGADTNSKNYKRCLEIFEQYATVNESVKAGIPITAEIEEGPRK